MTRPRARAQQPGHLVARPRREPGPGGPAGLQRLALGTDRDGLLYVPPGLEPDRPAPLAVMLHGAGGDSRGGMSLLRPLADRRRLILLAPDSRGRTWDVVLGGFGPDVHFLDAALERVFASYAIDPASIAVGGFSDGASYALSLGLTNGNLFTHVLAFSPGFAAPAASVDSPRLFVSHGKGDWVLPINRCSRVLVPALRRSGYDVQYVEFFGPHMVPCSITAKAVRWFLGPRGS